MRLPVILPLVLLLRMTSAAAQPVPPLALTHEQLAVLPQRTVTLTFGNPPAAHDFEGPLLWDVLTSSGTVDPARFADAVRQWVRVQAGDGYTAVLALGEVSPAFEGKPVILAMARDGTALERPRMVVPGDRSPGRSARDVTGLSVEILPEPRR